MPENVNEGIILKVNMLGGFSMTYGDKPCSFGRKSPSKFIQLFQLMMFNKDQGISKEKLMQALYDCEDVSNVNNSINNLIYRLRKQLVCLGLPEEEYIQVRNGLCIWCSSFPTVVDVREFETLVAAAEERNEQDYVPTLERACSLYQGELLPQLSTELWVIVESSRLKRLYEISMNHLCDYLRAKNEYSRMYRMVSMAASIYPFDEWQVYQMDCLMGMDMYREAYELYRSTADLYQLELGTSPSQEMLERLNVMSQRLMNPSDKLNNIKEMLEEEEWEPGAFYITYPSFIDIYRLIKRITERSGQPACLLLCALSNRVNGIINKEELKYSAGNLGLALKKVLRRGDVYTKHSSSQYLLLLVDAEEGDCQKISRRITQQYEMLQDEKGYKINYFLIALSDMRGEVLQIHLDEKKWKKL